MEQTFNVKEASIHEFFKEHLIGYEASDRNMGPRVNSAYHYMRDNVQVRTGSFNIGDHVKFELFDRAEGSGRMLVNTYLYMVQAFDSVSDMLVLIDFEVALKPQTI